MFFGSICFMKKLFEVGVDMDEDNFNRWISYTFKGGRTKKKLLLACQCETECPGYKNPETCARLILKIGGYGSAPRNCYETAKIKQD